MANAKKEPRWVKFVTEYLPLLLFLVAYLRGDLMLAIQVVVASTAVAVVVAFIIARRLPILPLLVAGSVVVFGGLSVFFDNENIYKMKPTVLNALFGIVLLGGLRFKQLFLERFMGDSMTLPQEAWVTLTVRYSVLFFVLAGLNEFIWRTQSEEFWVGFKMIGPLILIVLFTIAHVPFFKKYDVDPAA